MAGLTRPSTSFLLDCCKDVDARHKAGHDEFSGAIELASQARPYPLRTGEELTREFARPVTFLMIGARNEPRGRLVSTRPVSRCATSRNIRVVRWFAESSAIIWPLFAAVPNSRESKGIEAIGWVSTVLAKARGPISGRRDIPTWLRQ